MKKNNYIIITLPIIVLILYVYQFIKINSNLDTIFDEGFIFLKQQTTGINSIDKGSLFPTIINSIFDKHITSNLLSLRYLRFFVHLISVTLFSVLSAWYLYKKGILDSLEKKILFISVIYLMGNFALGGIVISYNTLQEFFIIIIVGCFFIATVITPLKATFLYVLIGFISFFSIMTTLPSGILVFCCVLILMWIKYINEWKYGLIFTGSIFFGMIISILVFHVFILDIRTVYSGIKEAAHTITTLDRGYDPFSFLTKVILYLRDFYMGICMLLSMTLIFYFVRKFTHYLVAIFVFLLSLVIFFIYQKKPEIVLSTYLAFPMIVLIVAILKETIKISMRKIFSFRVLLLLFLFFLPLISSIGTNVYLGTKMMYFILPWGVLFMELMCNEKIKEKYAKDIRLLLCLFVLLIVIQPIQSMMLDVKNKGAEKLFFNHEKPISQIQLTKQQKEYFEKVYGIMNEYRYHRKDVILSTQLDLMTIVALDGTPCGLYFQPMDFLAEKDKRNLKKPDFLFLTEFDLKLISDSIKSLNWDFPEEYDQYFVGTPETMITGYSTTRTLYCLKKRKIQ